MIIGCRNVSSSEDQPWWWWRWRRWWLGHPVIDQGGFFSCHTKMSEQVWPHHVSFRFSIWFFGYFLQFRLLYIQPRYSVVCKCAQITDLSWVKIWHQVFAFSCAQLPCTINFPNPQRKVSRIARMVFLGESDYSLWIWYAGLLEHWWTCSLWKIHWVVLF
jgi:hypothetical protein